MRKLTVSYLAVQNGRFTDFRPKITLSGKWMEKQGFQVGDRVKVIEEPNRIIIEK